MVSRGYDDLSVDNCRRRANTAPARSDPCGQALGHRIQSLGAALFSSVMPLPPRLRGSRWRREHRCSLHRRVDDRWWRRIGMNDRGLGPLVFAVMLEARIVLAAPEQDFQNPEPKRFHPPDRRRRRRIRSRTLRLEHAATGGLDVPGHRAHRAPGATVQRVARKRRFDDAVARIERLDHEPSGGWSRVGPAVVAM